MATPVVIPHGSEPFTCGSSGLRHTYFVAGGFLLCMVLQTLGYLSLGTNRAGMGLSETLVNVQHLLALACSVIAFRRARGTASLFWFLFLVTNIILLIPNFFLSIRTIFGHDLVSDSTWRALYLLYGAPVLMMLILPDSDHDGSTRWEIFLDLFQVTLVVALVFSTLFYLPLQQMLPADALEHNLSISNLESLILLMAVFIRLRFARTSEARDRLLRLGLFVLACAVVTFIGNWIDQHHYAVASAWWDLGWDVPIVAAGLACITWKPSPAEEANIEGMSFVGFVGKNFSLITLLVLIHVIIDPWKNSESMLTNLAVSVTLIAFTVRLAITQYHQHREILRRKAAQKAVTAANQKISLLLEDSRRQTDEITQINELGSLLQACSTPADAYRLIPERLQRLVPQSSGTLALLNASKNRVECVAEWGSAPPADQMFAPTECWALRRGCVHALSGGPSVLRCSHLSGEGASVCVPLIANGNAIGTLALQDERAFVASGEKEASDAFAHNRDLVLAVGEHVALALANLELREALRVQAVRDPLTGLYNRRYMQEFLDREAHRARRKNRPLSVLALDLDHFKLFNDTYGHAAGDHALSLVGQILLHSIRADDFACRSGGEEFVMILPECSLQRAHARAEEIRLRLRNRPVEYQGVTQERITVSIGVAALDETTDRVDRLLSCADEALYQAKREGRDRVAAARQIPAIQRPAADSATSAS